MSFGVSILMRDSTEDEAGFIDLYQNAFLECSAETDYTGRFFVAGAAGFIEDAELMASL